MLMPELDAYTVQLLTSFAAGVGWDALKAVFHRLRPDTDPFKQVFERALQSVARVPQPPDSTKRRVRREFGAGHITNTEDLARVLEKSVYPDRVSDLLAELVPALNEECRQLALSAEGGAEQAHRIVSEIYHRLLGQQHLQLQREHSDILDAIREPQESEAARAAPRMAPEVPEDFVERSAEYGQLRDALLGERDRPVAITTALEGAGGFGKTTLAAALCHDPEVREAFPDGVLWVSVGESPRDLTGCPNDWIGLLGGETQFATAQAARGELERMLCDRSLLMVIDDVWSSAHLHAFPRGGRRCARLITTRRGSVLRSDAIRIPVDAMLPPEAAKLLRGDLPDGADERFEALAKRLSRWPVLLKIVKGALRRRVIDMSQSLAAALDRVEALLDERGLTAFDPSNPQERSEAVRNTVEVGLELLSAEERTRYRELAIFPEDVPIPLAAVARLWRNTGLLSEASTEELCFELKDLSLLQECDLGWGIIRLHDVMRDYLAGELGRRLPRVHAEFLDAVNVKHWGELPADEPYLWRHLAYHLCEAGRAVELHALLLDLRWLRAKLGAADVPAVVADFSFLPGGHPGLKVGRAIRQAGHILQYDPGQLPEQLLARLDPGDDAGIAGLLHAARAARQGAWLRPVRPSIAASEALLHTLSGHQEGVTAVAVTADGRAVSASGTWRPAKRSHGSPGRARCSPWPSTPPAAGLSRATSPARSISSRSWRANRETETSASCAAVTACPRVASIPADADRSRPAGPRRPRAGRAPSSRWTRAPAGVAACAHRRPAVGASSRRCAGACAV